MRRTGAQLVVHALEQIGVQYVFGIPGVHNIELFDAFDDSLKITPLLTTHENGATFMADGLSRTSDKIGVAVIVPAAGLTNGLSGIGEAFLDGIPTLIISGGVRRDSQKFYQLHQIDQKKILEGISKKYYLLEDPGKIISTIYEAYEVATSGEPGPVFLEIPAEVQLFQTHVESLPSYTPVKREESVDLKAIEYAATLLQQSQNPGLYIGWGALLATEEVTQLAELLGAPVATTLQGLSAFSANHPLHVGVGFGPSSIPAAKKAFHACDCLLAVGLRFSELATGSYGLDVPENLIHVDINAEVFNKNYPAKVLLHGDAKIVLRALLGFLLEKKVSARDYSSLASLIKIEKTKYFETWMHKENLDLVSPGRFFKTLRKQVKEDAFVVVDDGKHTFLTAELFPIFHPKHFISPTDFNCMGYCIPAAIGAKLANLHHQVIAILGDGAFLMTAMELLTASTYEVGVVFFVFHDGELGQISQFQKVPLNRKTCSVIGDIRLKGIAEATGVHFISIEHDGQVEEGIRKALALAEDKQPVLVDVKIDYSQKTQLTKGVLKVNLGRFPLKEKIRFIVRAFKRRIVGS